MANTQDVLARAIEQFNAVELEPHRDETIGAQIRRFAFRNDGRWYIAGEGALRFSQTPAAAGYVRAAIPMPEWWAPNQQFAAFVPDARPGGRARGPIVAKSSTNSDSFIRFVRTFIDDDARVFTADLNTGAEVPA